MLSVFAIMWVSRAHLQPPCPQLSLQINTLSEIHLPKVPYKGLELKKPPSCLHKATQGQERDKGSPAVPSACTATEMWVPVSLRSVYTQLEKISYFRCSGTPAHGAFSAAFLHNTWNARWRFQKTFAQGQRDIFETPSRIAFWWNISKGSSWKTQAWARRDRHPCAHHGSKVEAGRLLSLPSFPQAGTGLRVWRCSTPDHHLWESKPYPEPCSGSIFLHLSISLDLWDGSAVLTPSLSILRILGWQRAQKMLLHLWNAS